MTLYTKNGILWSHDEKRYKGLRLTDRDSLTILGVLPNRIPERYLGVERKMFVARGIYGKGIREGKICSMEAVHVDATIHRGWYGPQTYLCEYVEVDGKGMFLIPLGESAGRSADSSIIRSMEDRWRERRRYNIECAKSTLKRCGFPVVETHDVQESFGWIECYGEVLVGILPTENERKEALKKILLCL